jgi:transposase-like protein
MRTRELKRLLAMTARLTPHQRHQLLAHLRDDLALNEVLALVEARHPESTACPRCHGTAVVRNGQANGLQRFKCRDCGRTFNALTGTSLARLHHREKWLTQTRVLDEGVSVRKAAARLGVHPTTAFRWRHRFLAAAREIKASRLDGVAEADETYLLRSYKGQRRRLAELPTAAARRPRRRGGHARQRGLSAEQVPILVLRDRAGRTTDAILEAANKRCVRPVLSTVLAEDAVLCTDGSFMLAAAARDLRIEHQPVNTSRGVRVRGPWHIQNVNAYHGRFKEWLRRFKGIATSYLENYLGWFRSLDRFAQTGAQPAQWLAMAARA